MKQKIRQKITNTKSQNTKNIQKNTQRIQIIKKNTKIAPNTKQIQEIYSVFVCFCYIYILNTKQKQNTQNATTKQNNKIYILYLFFLFYIYITKNAKNQQYTQNTTYKQ